MLQTILTEAVFVLHLPDTLYLATLSLCWLQKQNLGMIFKMECHAPSLLYGMRRKRSTAEIFSCLLLLKKYDYLLSLPPPNNHYIQS